MQHIPGQGHFFIHLNDSIKSNLFFFSMQLTFKGHMGPRMPRNNFRDLKEMTYVQKNSKTHIKLNQIYTL